LTNQPVPTAVLSTAAPTEAAYEAVLASFGALEKPGSECISYLRSLGYSTGQARNALYRFRKRHRMMGGGTAAQ
jgi:hypothetical protein